MHLPIYFLTLLLVVAIPTLPSLAMDPAPPAWQAQESGTDASFRGICAVSETVAWVSGTKGTVLRTMDSGKHWEKVSIPGAEALDFRDIEAFDDRTAFVLSSGPSETSRIYKTADGGKTWRLQFTNTEPKGFYDAFAFWDATHGIAMSDPVDGKFRLLMTEDGETWKALIPAALPVALPDEGGFAASGTCIAVSGKNDVWFVTGGPSGARVFHSSDRGLHWTVAPSPIVSGSPAQGIFSVAFAGTENGVIVGGDYEKPQAAARNAAYSTDGGKTWTLAERGPAGYRSAVACVPGSSPLLWVAVGTSGSDYSTDGGRTWLPLDSENYNALSFSRSGAGWAVGPKGQIARFSGVPAR